MNRLDNNSYKICIFGSERLIKKIHIRFVCMLLIATAIPVVESLKNNAINPLVPSVL